MELAPQICSLQTGRILLLRRNRLSRCHVTGRNHACLFCSFNAEKQGARGLGAVPRSPLASFLLLQSDPPFPPCLPLTRCHSLFRGLRVGLPDPPPRWSRWHRCHPAGFCGCLPEYELQSGSAWKACPLTFPEPSTPNCFTVVFKDTDSCRGSGFVHQNRCLSGQGKHNSQLLPLT